MATAEKKQLNIQSEVKLPFRDNLNIWLVPGLLGMSTEPFLMRFANWKHEECLNNKMK